MTLDDLYAEYKGRQNDGRKAFDDLVKRFDEGRRQTFMEAAACGAAVTGLRFDEGFDPSQLSPELQESFHLAFPNLRIEDVGNYSGEQLEGLLQPWKGKLFEVSVRDRLNNGEWVGDYHLNPEQHAALSASATQPGWDLQIIGDDGGIEDLIQLKATNYVGYVEAALNRYPEYKVLATSELGACHGDIAGLSVSDISDHHLETQFSDVMPGDDYGLLGLGLPVLPLVLNAYWVATGKRSGEEAVAAVAMSAAAMAGGHVLGGIAADAIGDLVGDAVVDGIGAALLDGLFGFGIFTGLRLLFGGSSKKARTRADEEARARAEQLRLEQLAIDSTCRHIDDRFETATIALEQMGKCYLLPAPASG